MNEIDIGHRLGVLKNYYHFLYRFSIDIYMEKADVIRCAFIHILISDFFSFHALMRCSTYTPFLMMWVAAVFCAFLLSMSHMWLGKKWVCHWVWNRHVLSWHKISHKYYLIDASREQVNAQHRDCCHDRKEKKWKAQDDWLIRDEKNEPVDFTADLSALSTTTLYMQCMHLFKWSR